MKTHAQPTAQHCPSKRNRNLYEQNYDRLMQLVDGLARARTGVAAKSVTPSFMDLHIDVLERTSVGLRIALAHYYKLNGDSVADPDMEVFVYLDVKMAEALTYQDLFGYRMVYPSENQVNTKAKRELNAFLGQWLKNCLAQGHKLVLPIMEGTG